MRAEIFPGTLFEAEVLRIHPTIGVFVELPDGTSALIPPWEFPGDRSDLRDQVIDQILPGQRLDVVLIEREVRGTEILYRASVVQRQLQSLNGNIGKQVTAVVVRQSQAHALLRFTVDGIIYYGYLPSSRCRAKSRSAKFSRISSLSCGSKVKAYISAVNVSEKRILMSEFATRRPR